MFIDFIADLLANDEAEVFVEARDEVEAAPEVVTEVSSDRCNCSEEAPLAAAAVEVDAADELDAALPLIAPADTDVAEAPPLALDTSPEALTDDAWLVEVLPELESVDFLDLILLVVISSSISDSDFSVVAAVWLVVAFDDELADAPLVAANCA